MKKERKPRYSEVLVAKLKAEKSPHLKENRVIERPSNDRYKDNEAFLATQGHFRKNPEKASEGGKNSKRPANPDTRYKKSLDLLLADGFERVHKEMDLIPTKDLANLLSKLLAYRLPLQRSSETRVEVKKITASEAKLLLEKTLNINVRSTNGIIQ